MTKTEFKNFTKALQTYYPREDILPTREAFELWYDQLNDLPYSLAEVSLKTWVAFNKWSPTIADIREQAFTITNGDKKTWSEAWEDVLQAIRIYGSYREGEALDSLDDATQKAVKAIGFKKLCWSDNLSIDRAHFRDLYNESAEKTKKQAILPPQITLQIQNLIEKGEQ